MQSACRSQGAAHIVGAGGVTYTHTHTHTPTCTRAHTHTHVCTHTHTHKPTHARTRTHTHTRALPEVPISDAGLSTWLTIKMRPSKLAPLVSYIRKRAEYGFGEHGFKHRTQWVFWPSPSSGERTQWVPLSLLFVCQSELTEFFAEVTEFTVKLREAQWVLFSETVLSKQYSARFPYMFGNLRNSNSSFSSFVMFSLFFSEFRHWKHYKNMVWNILLFRPFFASKLPFWTALIQDYVDAFLRPFTFCWSAVFGP